MVNFITSSSSVLYARRCFQAAARSQEQGLKRLQSSSKMRVEIKLLLNMSKRSKNITQKYCFALKHTWKMELNCFCTRNSSRFDLDPAISTKSYLSRITCMSMCTFVYSLATKCQLHISLSSEHEDRDQSRTSPCGTSLKLTFNNPDYNEHDWFPCGWENRLCSVFLGVSFINILLSNEFLKQATERARGWQSWICFGGRDWLHLVLVQLIIQTKVPLVLVHCELSQIYFIQVFYQKTACLLFFFL